MGNLNRAYTIFREDGIRSLVKAIRGEIRYRLRLKKLSYAKNAISQGYYGGAIGWVTEWLTGKNIYFVYVKSKNSSDSVERNVLGYRMQLNLEDPGLSKGLLCSGVREVYSTKAYIDELERLERSKDSVTVLEVGANIGYYALIAADILGDKADIHAIEPSPKNLEFLEKNIELNGFEDSITVHPIAISNSQGSITFDLAKKANQNRIQSEFIEGDQSAIVESIEVDVTTVQNFLERNDLPSESIDVVRMDVQGAEYGVIEGMQNLLLENDELMLFIETHPNLLSEDKQSQMISWIRDSGFEVISAATSSRNNLIATLEDPDAVKTGMELILRKTTGS